MTPEQIRKITRLNLLALAIGHFIFAGFAGVLMLKLLGIV
jgi:hypothetical protein